MLDTDLGVLHEYLTPEQIQRMFCSREFDSFFSRIARRSVEERDLVNDPYGSETARVWAGREILFDSDVAECVSDGCNHGECGADPDRRLNG